MTLTVAHVLQQMKHELGGGDFSIELDTTGILNQAGHHLYSMHPWRWSHGRAALLDFRGVVSGATATWTAATKTLTQTGAFTNYSFLSGDESTINSGTGATPGVYKVASRVSANAVTLVGSISAVDLSTGNIDWIIHPDTVALPSDLRDITHIASSSETSIFQLTLTSLEYILERRGSSTEVSTPALFYGAVVYNGTPPVPILEIWPSPAANATGALRIFYRSRWTAITADSQQIPIPDFTNDLYVWIARAYAGGYERGDQMSIHERLAQLALSPIFEYAKRSDGMIQPFHNRVLNGAARKWLRPVSDFQQIQNMVEGPI